MQQHKSVSHSWKASPEVRSVARNRFAPILVKNELGKVAGFVIAARALLPGWKLPAPNRQSANPEAGMNANSAFVWGGLARPKPQRTSGTFPSRWMKSCESF